MSDRSTALTKKHSPRLCPKCNVNWISVDEVCDCDAQPLVERLRKGTCAFSSWPANSGQVCDIMIEAADEIERLTSVASAEMKLREGNFAEIERLLAKLDEGELWSFFRRLLDQGRAIQKDDAAGKYPTYEHLSARIDEAARERVDQFLEPETPK